MSSILLPVDGSESSMHALDYVIDKLSRFPNEHRPMLHVLNVQALLSLNFNNLVQEEYITKHYETEGRQIVNPVESLLKSKKIAHALHILVADDVPTSIADFAKESGCELIVMGTRGLGKVQDIMLGSVARKVVHVSSVPVLLVK